MVSAISKVLKNAIGEQIWLERFTGLVVPAVKPKFVTSPTGAQVVQGREVYPVSCEVNEAKCFENGTYKLFTPDSSVASIAFFVDNGGANLRQITGPKRNIMSMTFDVKLLVWLNLRRLCVTDCDLTGRLVPYLIAALAKQHSTQAVFSGGVEEGIYQNIAVTNIRQLVKSPSMFEPFTFAREGEARGLFLYPYDYFGLQITGTFDMNALCLPELFSPDFEFCDENCVQP